MMGKTLLLLLMISLLAVPACSAQISPSLRSYLSTYVTSGTISGSTFYNQTVGASSYVLMQPNPSSYERFLVINTTNGRYSMVTSNAIAFNVISPFLVSKFYPSPSALAGLNSSMRSFVSQSSPGINQCLFETGLTYHLCTAATSLEMCMESSCAYVPLCGGVQRAPASALALFGIPSPFAYGVQNFSINYITLNNSYNSYFSLLSGINSSNYEKNLNGMISAVSNITATTGAIADDPIFPSPSNITLSQITSTCTRYIPPNGPWWCYAVGYCDAPTFNSLTLSNVSSQLSVLAALPVSSAEIESVTVNSTSMASGYIGTVVNSQNTAAFNKFMSSLAASVQCDCGQREHPCIKHKQCNPDPLVAEPGLGIRRDKRQGRQPEPCGVRTS